MVHKIIFCLLGLTQFYCFNSNIPKHTQIVGVWIDLNFKDSIEQGVLPCHYKHNNDLVYIISHVGNDTFKIYYLAMNDDNGYFISSLQGDSIEYVVQNMRFKFNLRENDTLDVNINGRSSLFVRSQFETEVRSSLHLGTLTYKYFLPYLNRYDISPAMDTFLRRNFDSFGCSHGNILTGKTNRLLVEVQNDTLKFYDVDLPKSKPSHPFKLKKSINSVWPKKK